MSDFAGQEPPTEAAAPPMSPEVAKSYLAFIVRAVRNRRFLAAGIFLAFAIATGGLLKVWPRTYHCDAMLMVQANQVAFSDSNRIEGLHGANEVILRRQNVEGIVRRTDLVNRWERTRSPLLALKDRISRALRGAPSPAAQELLLIGTLQTSLGVERGDGTLKISLDWPDAETSAVVVDAAIQSFLEARHGAEISTIADYIAILEGHAEKSRADIDAFAAQIASIKDNKLQKLSEAQPAPGPVDASAAPAARPSRPVAALSAPALPSESELADLKGLRENIDIKQRQLDSLEAERARRVTEIQAKITEMGSQYTEAHPVMADLRKKLESFSREPAATTALRAELAGLKQALASKTPAAVAAAGGKTTPGFAALPSGAAAKVAAAVEPLPADVMRLLQDTGEGVDPAIDAQFRNAVDKYAGLRSQVSTLRVELDTAQAAFKRRYQMVVPAEAPAKAVKPKVPVMLAGGLVAGLLLALVVCVIGELRSDRLVALWQVHAIGLPILGELRLPPGSSE